MACVETLLELLLLYLVNAEEDVTALEVVEVEFLQLSIVLAPEGAGARSLRTLFGDLARGDLARGEAARLSALDHLCSGARKAVGLYIEGGE